MASINEVQGVIGTIGGLTQTAATIVEGQDPAVAMDTETAASLAAILIELLSVGVGALKMAQETAITTASIDALAPDPAPLTPPTA